jgi:DNA primase
MIPDEVISEIRSRVDIVAVIGEHVQLKKAGRNWKGLCPFHGEKTPSFSVSPDKGFYYCFGCRKKGDALSFVMEYGGRSFHEAIEQLAARVGVVLPREEESPELRRARSERAAMLDLNRAAAEFFRDTLAHPTRGAPGRAYLDKRGVGDAISTKFMLGYAPNDWHALADPLQARRLDLELAVKLGLIARQPRAGGFYDRYRERLVCPVIVPGGDVVGFSARVVDGMPPAPDVDPPPKYINSPESTVYKKSKLLFGLAQARESMAIKKRAVLVEGNFDVISLHQAGFTEVVAPLGTALTPEQVDLLRRLAERVVLLYDGDRAGRLATRHALEMCAAADVEVQVAFRRGNARDGGAGPLDNGLDPDAMVTSGRSEQLAAMLDNARDGFEHYAISLSDYARQSADAKSRALDDAAKLLAKVANPTKRDLIVHRLAIGLEVDQGVVHRAVSRSRGATAGPGAQPARPDAPKTAPPPTDEVEVLALLVDHPDLISTDEADKAFSLLTDTRLRDICSAARAGQSLVDLATSLPEPTANLVLSGKYAADPEPRSRLAAMATGLDHRKAVVGLNDLRARLALAKRDGDRELERRLVAEIVSTRKQVD